MGVPDDDPILDAARATALDFGMRRTTVSEVARRAGVSRMTVHRRYPDGQALLRALMAREFGGVLERAEAHGARAPSERERLVASAVRTVELFVTDPLLLRLLEVDAELLLPYFTGDPGPFRRMARELSLARVRAGQSEGSIRAGDPRLMAETCELAVRGLVLARRTLGARRRRAALGELRLLLDATSRLSDVRQRGPRERLRGRAPRGDQAHPRAPVEQVVLGHGRLVGDAKCSSAIEAGTPGASGARAAGSPPAWATTAPGSAPYKRRPPCRSLELQRLVPGARSRRSRRATLRPRESASSATPAPVIPPPTTSTSTGSPAARSARSAARRARRPGVRAGRDPQGVAAPL
jgi:AcrR family transcriptional regulator